MTHPCAAPGCRTQIAEERLMCLPHWRMISPALQQAVWRTWRALQRSSRDEYQTRLAEYATAREQAVQCVCEAGKPVGDLFLTPEPSRQA